MALSAGRPEDLPDFRNPPLAETVLSLQFEPLAGLTTAHVGLLWDRFRKQFPMIEEHPPLPPVFEKFELPSPPQIEVSFEEKPPVPRVWFLNEAGSELIQVQSDRFIHNWRKMEGLDPYPRYEPIRDRFRDEVGVLEKFLREEKLGALVVNQCEVTYVNHIEPAGVWGRHGEVEKAFVMCSRLGTASFLHEPEDVALRMRFVIPGPKGNSIGRLHAVVQPAWKKSDNSPILTLNLTARGSPIGEDIKGAFAFFELGRSWIVKGFADLTTPAMQRMWERIDG
jgi:uncharacterized protein (TIGR04255 family)